MYYEKLFDLNPDLNVAVRKAKGIYYCPSVKTPATLTDDKLAFSSVNNVYTYGMGSTYGTDAKIKRIPGKDWLKTTQLKGKGASAQFLFGDINDHGMNGDITQGPMLQVWANDSKLRIGKRHNGGINAAWMDGHADFRKPHEMNGVTTAEWKDGNYHVYYFMMYP